MGKIIKRNIYDLTNQGEPVTNDYLIRTNINITSFGIDEDQELFFVGNSKIDRFMLTVSVRC
jgi:hypothetical protein